MADNSKFIQTQTFKLAGGGISLSDTSISLQSFKFPPATGSAPITMAHLGTICTATIEPGAAKEEIISFTGVTQNGDGSATLTGVTRGLKFGDTAGDYGQDLSLRKSHAGNTTFVITNNPQFYNKFAAKDNDEVITGDWQVPAPAAGPSVVNKDYVDAAIGGGVGTATDTTFGTVKGTKNQGSKPKVISALVREQATPNKTLKVESFRQTFIDKVVAYAGGNTPNFIDPAMGGDLAFALTPSNGETITITVDGTACVFTAVTTIGATPGNFLIGGSAAVARANFTALVNNPTVTSANQVAFSGAQLTAIQKLSATDDLALNTFIRVTNPATTTFSVTETMAGAGNIWTVNSTKTRYDIVVVDNAGALQIRKGSEAVSPVVPTPTSGDLTLALVLNRIGQTTIRDTDVAGHGYIVELYTPSIYRTDLVTTSLLKTTDVQAFTTAGSFTWTKPAGAKYVEVTVIGGGGAGGSGNTTNVCGGGGGGWGYKRFDASALGATENVTVGAAGVAGANNTPGGAGGFSSFGTTVLLRADGGAGGSGSASVAGGGANGDINFTGGASGSSYSGAAPSIANSPAPRGGGNGGYNSGSPAIAAAGGAGGGFTTYYVLAGGAGGAAGVNNGVAGNSPSTGYLQGGTGGGGGGFNGNGTNTGGNGGAGGFPGGGGGGSQGTNNTGGNGARGMVYVVTYF